MTLRAGSPYKQRMNKSLTSGNKVRDRQWIRLSKSLLYSRIFQKQIAGATTISWKVKMTGNTQTISIEPAPEHFYTHFFLK